MWRFAVVVVGAIFLLSAPFSAEAAKPELKGKFEYLKDEPSALGPNRGQGRWGSESREFLLRLSSTRASS